MIGPEGRHFTDAPAARGAIFHEAREAVAGTPPLENERFRLELSDVAYAGPSRYTASELKNMRLRGDTAARRMDGTWSLIDKKTNEAVARRRMVVARVPYYSDDGAFLLNGVRWGLASQLRSAPGAYSRVRPDGVFETAFNPAAGTGRAHKLLFDPKTGRFALEAGASRVPLAGVLAAAGKPPGEWERAWGREVARANPASIVSGAAGDKFAALAGRRPRAGEAPPTVNEALAAMKYDPWVTERTLEGGANGGADMLLAASRKLLRMAKLGEPGDERSSLAFLTAHGPEHLIAERVRFDQGALRRAFWKATIAGDLNGMRSGAFTGPMIAAIRESGIGQASEEVNPLSLVDQQSRLTRMGQGGIGAAEAVPLEARAVHPSQFGFVDPVVTPENMAAGVDMRTAIGARLGRAGELLARFRSTRTGQEELVSPRTLHDAVVAFPGEMAPGKRWVRGIARGRLSYVKASDVDYVLPDMALAFSPLSSLVPMKSGAKGQRLSMGVRFLSQALPLKDRQAPLVQGRAPGSDESYERRYGALAGAAFADAPGRVVNVTPEEIVIDHGGGRRRVVELVEHAPYNRKTGTHREPLVRAGDVVAAGQPVARSESTDENGETALGRNVRVAMLPGFGKHSNYEDAFVISRGLADKLTSVHYHQYALPRDEAPRQGRRDYLAMFPSKFSREHLSILDEDGVVRPGSVLVKGAPMALGFAVRAPSRARVFHNRGASALDKALLWDHDEPGTVTSVVKTESGPRFVVRREAPMRIGDKLANRYGAKGVVSSIVPDEEMPVAADGAPVELLYNPAMTNSRVNPAAIVEMALGKAAALEGRPVLVPDFNGESAVERALAHLRARGLASMEDMRDPTSGKAVRAFVGNGYFMKLHHMAEAKAHGRGIGGYTAEGLPAKGLGDESSKRLSLGEVGALLSSGAERVIRDGLQVRGQTGPEFWARYMSGHDAPLPREPLVHRKFYAQLKAAGINAARTHDRIQVMALSGAEIARLAQGRSLRDGRTVDFERDMKPFPGGLFDPAITGGHGGSLWSALDLAEPMPNPAMEGPVRRVLGLTGGQLREVIAGQRALGGATGPEAVRSALAAIDLPKEIDRAREAVRTARGQKRDDAVRRLGYLLGARDVGLHPRDWIWDKAPVVPPIFRPVSRLQGSGAPLVDSANTLYGDLWRADRNLRDLKGKVADVGPERLAVYDALRAVAGLGAPIHAETARKGVKGALAEIVGPTSKYGSIQRKLLSGTVDAVGRAVVVPDPDLGLDEVGVPEAKLFEVYRPAVVRRLVRSGMDRLAAARAVEERTDKAVAAARAEMAERPVLLSRAPVLHRYGILAFRPRPVAGDVLRVNPFVTNGFGMDFDGDMSNFHVPISDEAVEEALDKLLPSRHLRSPATFRAHQLPIREHALGLYFAGRPPAERPPIVFPDARSAIAAYHDGEIALDQPVRIR